MQSKQHEILVRFVTEEISFITNNEIIIKKNEID